MNRFSRGLRRGLVFLLVSGWLEGALAQVPVVVSVGRNFTGISYGSYNTNSSALPPDCNGVAGPDHLVELINGAFAVYTKTNGQEVQLMTDLDFWAQAGVGVDVQNGWDVTDPRVIYDAAVRRWFASQVDVDALTFALDGTLSPNHFLLAVSAGADPTGPWRGVLFDADPVTGNFADFPTLGLDGNGVYLSGDLFDANNNPVGPLLVSFPKADLLAAPPVMTNRTSFGVMSYSERGQVLQPAICFDGTSQGRVLAASDIGNDSAPHSNLVSFAVQNVTGPGPATLSPVTVVPTLPWEVPYNSAVSAPLLTPVQPDGTATLQANDARLSAKVYAVGGVLYAVHNTELNGRIAIRWYRVRATDGFMLESGTIADTNLDLFFPSIAANAAGTVVIAFNGSGLGTYVTCYAMAGQTAGGVTTFGPPLLLQAGATSYHDDYETLGLDATSRWGDYSTTCVDPSEPSRFWTIQMFPSDVDVWSTQITELLTAPAMLSIASARTNVTVSWPSVLAGYQLQSAASLQGSVLWSNVTQAPLTKGSELYVVLPVSPAPRFFRLFKP